MWVTTARQKRNVARWREAGWVTADGERHILAELDAGTSPASIANTFGMVAAVLLGCAVLSFVAANWQEMSKLARMLMLVGTMAAGYAAAGAFYQRGQDGFANAAVLFAVLVYGASIMLISQMYHIDGHPPDAALWWALGALAAGLALRSNPALTAALALFGLWSVWETASGYRWAIGGKEATPPVHWPFPLAVAAVAAGFWRNGWRAGLELCALAIVGWVFSIGILVDGGRLIVPVIGAVVALVAILAETSSAVDRTLRPETWRSLAQRVVFYAAIVLFGGIFMNMLRADLGYAKSGESAVIWYVLGLVFAAGGVWRGATTSDHGLTRLAYAAFALTILVIFFRTVGSLIGTSGFFLAAGLVAIALAVLGRQLGRLTGAGATGATPPADGGTS